jgi:superfamily I DNA/RNA helicase
MKMPPFSDLTLEQRRLYQSVPFTGRTLIYGPPGTGKTVVALLRALESSRGGRTTTVTMFNRMLQHYAGKPASLDAKYRAIAWPTVKTVRWFFTELWYELRLPPHRDADTVMINVPYEEKALGARWDTRRWPPDSFERKKKRPGVWCVTGEQWRANQTAFADWYTTSEPPTGDDQGFEIDWVAYASHVIEHTKGTLPAAANWGHLIVDEGQDFPPDFYSMLSMLMDFGFTSLKPEQRPAVTVLADENQRLTLKKNSTIKDIVERLKVPEQSRYLLEENFRNTEPIAKAAAHFYADMATGIPKPPKRNGPVPQLKRFDSAGAACDFIVNYAKTNVREQIGVLLPDDNQQRKEYREELLKRLPGERVKSYAWADQTADKPGDIPFEEDGLVLVINRASAKGLEFDAVFIVELQNARVDAEKLDFFKMGMYVMCSRARKALFLAWRGTAADKPAILSYLPKSPVVTVSP